MERIITVGDSYLANRALYSTEVVNNDTLAPMDLTGLIVQTTFKPAPDDDPLDEAAVIYAEMRVDNDGNVTSDGLILGGAVTDGIVLHILTSAQSREIPPGTTYVSDFRITRPPTEPGGEPDVRTFHTAGTLIGIRGITNRSWEGGDA